MACRSSFGSGLPCSPWGILWILADPGCSACGLGFSSRRTALSPFQCVGPRQLMRREGAEPSAPGTSTGAFRSVPSRRAPSLASASCSKSLARATNRRPGSTTTFQVRGRCCPSGGLPGGSGVDGGSAWGCWLGQGLGWGHEALGVQSWFCLQLAMRFRVSHFPSVGLSVPVCGMGQEGERRWLEISNNPGVLGVLTFLGDSYSFENLKEAVYPLHSQMCIYK